MRRFLLVSLLATLAACSKAAPPNGAVKLTVSYPGFKPACVHVSARDAEDASKSNATDLPGKGDTAETRSLTVAVFREPTWSRTLEVTAEVYDTLSVVDEKNTCTGTLLARKSRSLTVADGKVLDETLALEATDADGDGHLAGADVVAADCQDGDKAVHPGAQESCNGKDDNCNGGTDEGFEVGALCDGPNSCQGAWACNATGGRTCAVSLTQWYPDADGDGYGASGGTPKDSCTQPQGHAPNNGDCNDANAALHPGATELCNGVDEDCDGSPTNGLDLGASCTPASGCTGERACDGQGGVTCMALTQPTSWYPDEDLDTRGKQSAGVSACSAPPGYIATGGDCDDGDPFTYTGATELCDTKDNDCNGSAEGAGVCPAGAAWTSYDQGSRNWMKISLWGNGGVWVAGVFGGRAVKAPQDTNFTVYDTNCTSHWYSVWADPVSGRAYVGGSSDALAIQDVGSGSCTSKPPSARDDTLGLMGFRAGDGSVTLYGVGAKPDDSAGWVFTWNGSSTAQTYTATTDALFDVHGLSADLLFAVGGPTSPNEPRIYRYNSSSGQWAKEANVPTASLDRLNDVWVVHSKLAYAVGSGGSILKWDGTSWSKVEFNGGSTSALTGVLAFGTNALYVTTLSGGVFRYNGQDWQELFDLGGSSSATDIAGTSPQDIWVTGEDGRIVHWPK